MRSQDALITRILNMPTPVDLLKDIKNTMPKFIIRNRQLFEVVFTLIQIHPCYLQNLICHTPMFDEPREVKNLLTVVFGANSLIENHRVMSTLMVIAAHVLSKELKNKNIKEFTGLTVEDSVFR